MRSCPSPAGRVRVVRRRSVVLATLVLAPLVAAAVAVLPADQAAAGSPGTLALSGSTAVGVHNAYEKATYTYFANALDSGAALLELDVWTDPLSRRWRVSHDNPFGDDNNCTGTLTTGTRNQDLGSCLDDVAAWHAAHPGHRPVLFKIEMKNGFNNDIGLGPDEFDALVAAKAGSFVYRPADLVDRGAAGTYASLDEAARAGNWPTRDQLAGRVLFELIPGTVEEQNPLDHLWTDAEYGGYLRSLAAAGTLARASAFPAVHGAATGDPRTRYADAGLRDWFVLFDGDASTYVAGSIDLAWYDARHYLLVMTDAAAVPPALDATHPAEADALARVSQLAAAHASIVSTDWATLSTVLSTVVARGG